MECIDKIKVMGIKLMYTSCIHLYDKIGSSSFYNANSF